MQKSVRGKACLALVVLVLASTAACRREEPEPPPVATPSFSVKQTRVPLGSPVEVTYKFVVEKNAPPIAENFRVFVHFLDADNERMWTDDHDPADSDDAVEAGADHRIHQDDVRARLSVSGRDDGVDGPLFARIGFALAARREESRPAVLRRRTTRAAAADRGHLRDVQGGLARGRNAAGQRRHRMAVVEERGDAVGAEIPRRTSRCICTSIIRGCFRSRSR